jgi:hypothetical protein
MDGKVRLWDVTTGEEAAAPENVPLGKIGLRKCNP